MGKLNLCSFLIEDNENEKRIWQYNKEILKMKIRSHGDDEVKDFYDKKFHKVESNHTCLSVIRLNSALKKDQNYYPQVFLKQCKYIGKI